MKQVKHLRKSKRGKLFRAGKGISKQKRRSYGAVGTKRKSTKPRSWIDQRIIEESSAEDSMIPYRDRMYGSVGKKSFGSAGDDEKEHEDLARMEYEGREREKKGLESQYIKLIKRPEKKIRWRNTTEFQDEEDLERYGRVLRG